jgi:hypothetical protein
MKKGERKESSTWQPNLGPQTIKLTVL